PTGETLTPDTLVTTNSATQTLTANAPVTFASNAETQGDSIAHTENTANITLNEEGLYILYYNGQITGSGTATYPLTATVAVYQDGNRINDSSTSARLNSSGQQRRVSGDTAIRVSVGASSVPSTITLRNETNNITWNYAEIIVGKIL
ncbi:MAG: hypothetical protein Q4C25_08175, partial [Bacillota bacterium]|nr:hypothetical protein [Bacillota bacterium]